MCIPPGSNFDRLQRKGHVMARTWSQLILKAAKGIRVLERLRGLSVMLPKLGGLVACIHAATGEDAIWKKLRSEIVVAVQVGVTVSCSWCRP